jgi:hypothetical protein
MDRTYYKPGSWNAVCDRCGVYFKAEQLRKTWEGFMVCEKDWEMRHIADFIKAPKSVEALPFARPVGTDVSIGPTYISTSTGSQDTTLPSGNSGNGSTT